MKDLRSFIELLRNNHPEQFVEVDREVDPRFEMSALIAKLESMGSFPAVVFRHVKGSRMPVVSNMHSSFGRVAIALDTTEEELGRTYRERESSPIPPKSVSSGPVKETILKEEKVDLTKQIPNVYYHEKDGGPYIALASVVMKDPELGHINLGVYRIMIQGPRQLGVYLAQTSQGYLICKKYEIAKKPMDVALIIGNHPAFCIGSVANTAPGVNQYSVAGGILGEAIELTKCETVDLDVPASSEIVIEGVIPPGVTQMEGPFGEFTGVYGVQSPRPIIKVNALTMRANPLYQDAFSGHPDNLILGYFARLNAIYKTLNQSVRTVKDIHLPIAGRCRFVCYIALRKMIEGEPKNACFAAFAADPFLKYAIVVDDDTDIKNDSAVMQALAMWVRPERDIFVVSGAKGSPLDPTAQEGYLVSKVGIDATRKPGMPERLSVPGVDKIKIEDYIARR